MRAASSYPGHRSGHCDATFMRRWVRRWSPRVGLSSTSRSSWTISPWGYIAAMSRHWQRRTSAHRRERRVEADPPLGDTSHPDQTEGLRGAALSVEGLSDTIRSRNVGELVTAASDTARTHPAAFFVGAMAAGFALSRFVKSSSLIRASRSGDYGSRGAVDFGGRT